MIILPRQARGKHRENSEGGAFSYRWNGSDAFTCHAGVGRRFCAAVAAAATVVVSSAAAQAAVSRGDYSVDRSAAMAATQTTLSRASITIDCSSQQRRFRGGASGRGGDKTAAAVS
jgi:hypothetical protein